MAFQGHISIISFGYEYLKFLKVLKKVSYYSN